MEEIIFITIALFFTQGCVIQQKSNINCIKIKKNMQKIIECGTDTHVYYFTRAKNIDSIFELSILCIKNKPMKTVIDEKWFPINIEENRYIGDTCVIRTHEILDFSNQKQRRKNLLHYAAHSLVLYYNRNTGKFISYQLLCGIEADAQPDY
jgi:hypothetical protein